MPAWLGEQGTDVTVIGNSTGGWITAEIALVKSPRVSGIVLIDAVGIEVPGHPVDPAQVIHAIWAAPLLPPQPGPLRPTR